MTTNGWSSRLLSLALLAGPVGGCWTECAGGGGQTIAPGDTFKGVDPRRALAALPVQTVPLTWTRTGETTTLTITPGPSDEPSNVVYDCGGDPGFSVAADFAVSTDDGRLDGTFTAKLPADVSATLTLPAKVEGLMPATLLLGTGVVSDTFLDPAVNALAFAVAVNAAGDGATYGYGGLYLAGRDQINVAYTDPAP